MRASHFVPLNLSAFLIHFHGLGNKSNTESFLGDISVLKNVSYCPNVEAVFEEDGYENPNNLTTELTRAFHPYGKCCKVVIPSSTANETLLSIGIVKHDLETYKGFRVFLSNQESYHQFFKNKFNINGPMIIVMFAEKERFILYNVKISEEIDLPIDGEDSCKNYESATDYEMVKYSIIFNFFSF